MKYMIMECRPGYAVALDEDGNFLKVANRQYEVGQTVSDVTPVTRKSKKWLYPLAAMAACLALLLTLFLPGAQQPYASVYVKINPEVRIDVDKNDQVIGLSGVNQDGTDLIAGYDYHKKNLDLVTDELVDKAIDMGYLTAQGQITISLESTDQAWIDSHTQSISSHLQTHMEEKFTVEILIELYEELGDELVDELEDEFEDILEPEVQDDDFDDDDDEKEDDDRDEPDDDDDLDDDDFEDDDLDDDDFDEADDDDDDDDDDRDEPDDDDDDDD